MRSSFIAIALLAACGGNKAASPPPAAPTGLSAAGGAGSITLAWTASSGATGYVVQRGSAAGGPYSTVASPASPGFTDTGLPASPAYFYVVQARSDAGTSGNLNEATASTQAPARSAPRVPAGLTATATGTTIALSWTAVADATESSSRARPQRPVRRRSWRRRQGPRSPTADSQRGRPTITSSARPMPSAPAPILPKRTPPPRSRRPQPRWSRRLAARRSRLARVSRAGWDTPTENKPLWPRLTDGGDDVTELKAHLKCLSSQPEVSEPVRGAGGHGAAHRGRGERVSPGDARKRPDRLDRRERSRPGSSPRLGRAAHPRGQVVLQSH